MPVHAFVAKTSGSELFFTYNQDILLKNSCWDRSNSKIALHTLNNKLPSKTITSTRVRQKVYELYIL